MHEQTDDLAELSAVATAARAGTARIAVIGGPAGIGRSALLAAVADRERRLGSRVLTACCGPRDRTDEFGLVRQLFEPLRGEADVAALLDQLERRTGAPDADDMSDPADDAATAAVTHRLHAITARLAADVMLVLVIDDLQWVDRPSLQWLGHLARRLDSLSAPVLVVLAMVTDEDPPEPQLIAEVTSRPTCRTLSIRRLGQPAIAAMVAQAYRVDPQRADSQRVDSQRADPERVDPERVDQVAPAFVTACAEESAGLPARIHDLLRLLVAEDVAPRADQVELVRQFGERVRSRAAVARLGHQPAHVRRLAATLAVLGERADPQLAAALCEQDRTHTRMHLDRLAAIGVLRPGPAIVFSGPSIVASLLDTVGQRAAVELRLRAARLLSDHGAPLSVVAGQLAETECAGDPWACSVLQDAAGELVANGNPRLAATYLRRLLRGTSRDGVRAETLIALGRAEVLFDPDVAARHFAESARLAVDTHVRAESIVHWMHAELIRGCDAGVARAARDVLADLREQDVAPRGRDVVIRLNAGVEALGCGSDGDASWDSGACTTGIPIALPSDSAGSSVAREAVAALALRLSRGGNDRVTAVSLAEQALGDGELPARGSIGLCVRAVGVLAHADRIADGITWTDRLLSDAVGRGAPTLQVLARGLRADLRYRAGDLEESRAEAAEAMLLSEQPGLSGLRHIAVGQLLRIQVELTPATDAEQVAQWLRQQVPDTDYCHTLLTARGRLKIAAGDLRSGLADLHEAGHRAMSHGIRNPAISPWRALAAPVHAELGDHTTARELAADEVERARAWGAPRALGIALRAQAAVVERDGAAALLEEADEVLRAGPARLEHARVLTDLGINRYSRGSVAAARANLREGLALAQRCGASRLAEQAYDALVMAGGRPRRTSHIGPEALTPTERVVAQLASTGRTNRQISTVLGVVPSTVEVHLTNIYRKLGGCGRSGLAGALLPLRTNGHALAAPGGQR